MPSSVQQLLQKQQLLIQDTLLSSLQKNLDEIGFSPENYHFLLYFLQQKQDQNITTESASITETSEELHQLFLSLTNSCCHDHIEGGFFDGSLKKSLTHNAKFLTLFSDFSGYFFDGFFSVPAIHSAQWLINNLQSEEGIFYQGMGTDSDELLSDYYSIRSEELDNLLDKDSRTAFFSAYGIALNDSVIPSKLTQIRSYKQVAEDTGLHIKQVPLALENALQLLSITRKNKTPPGINQTLSLVDNCRVIISLFKAARQFNRDDFSASALTALESLSQHFPSQEVTDCADYLLLLQTLIERLRYQWCENTFQRLETLAFQFLKSPANNTEKIIQTMEQEKLISCIEIFYTLALLTDNKDFQIRAVSVSIALENMILDNSTTNPILLTAYLRTLSQSHLILITGKAYDATYWSQQLSSGFNPSNNIFVIADNVTIPKHLRFPPGDKTRAIIYQLGSSKSKQQKAKQAEDSLQNLLENYSSTKKRYPEGYLL